MEPTPKAFGAQNDNETLRPNLIDVGVGLYSGRAGIPNPIPCGHTGRVTRPFRVAVGIRDALAHSRTIAFSFTREKRSHQIRSAPTGRHDQPGHL